MPTKRFDNLDPERRRQILEAAACEFAARGFEGASMNQIIATAGTSKGSMYYYFEDKADLYATVVRDTVARFVDYCGVPGPVTTAEAYWQEVERFTRKSVAYYELDPHLAGIIRSMVQDGASVAPLAETRMVTAGFLGGLIEVGQAVGAVRTDLPPSLIMTVAASLSEGIDVWLAEHLESLDPDAREAVTLRVVDMYRRLAAPLEHP